MFGDNKAMVDSSMLPEGQLTKRSVALAFHRVREMIAAKALYCFHIPGTVNVSDCMTKPLSRRPFWYHVKPVLFWAGDTIECHVSRTNQRVDARLRNCVPSGSPSPSTMGLNLSSAMEPTILALGLIIPGQSPVIGQIPVFGRGRDF